MADRDWNARPRARRALAATALAAALSLGFGATGALGQDDDEENLSIDTKIFRQIMKDFGAVRDGPQIEYRERAPLVVPPSRNLPPPRRAGAAPAADPAWPKDPDVVARQKKASAAERAKLKGTNESWVDDSRPLRPDELARGKVPAKPGPAAPAAPDAEGAMRPMTPDQLGNKTFVDKLLSVFTPGKREAVPFAGEPPRTSMTDPPPGYQVPSAQHPYGVGPAANRTVSTVADRVEPSR